MIETEQQLLIEEAMESLSIKQRAAVTLFYEDGMKQRDAADVMGMSVKGFESLLMRAKAALKDQLLRSETMKRRA